MSSVSVKHTFGKNVTIKARHISSGEGNIIDGQPTASSTSSQSESKKNIKVNTVYKGDLDIKAETLLAGKGDITTIREDHCVSELRQTNRTREECENQDNVEVSTACEGEATIDVDIYKEGAGDIRIVEPRTF